MGKPHGPFHRLLLALGMAISATPVGGEWWDWLQGALTDLIDWIQGLFS